MRSNRTRMSNYHTTLDFCFIDTTKQQTNVITSFTFIQQLTEHFYTGNHRLLVFAQTKDLNFITYFHNTSLNTTSCYSTTTSNREYVLNRHQERLFNVTNRLLNPSITSVHKFHYLIFPFRHTIQGTQSRTTDNRSIFFEVISCQQLTHFHLNELQHFFVVNHIALVQEYDQTRNVYLTSQQDVLTSLRHRTISCSNYDDSTIHLRSTSYHVLYIVGVSRAVNVCIVTVCSFILNV